MKQLFPLIFLLLCIGCKKDVHDQITNLEGYWNIEKVVMSDGSEREFPFSNHMDYFEIEGYNGIKYRVSPTYDGRFINYGSPVNFTWKLEDDELILHFKDGESAYQQIVEKVTAETLVLKHENGTVYNYSAYNPNDAQQ